MLLEHFLPHCINRLFFSQRIRKKKSSFTSWWIKFAHFLCSLGDLPADVDLQTGVWGGGKAVCRQEVPLIYIFLFHRHINYVLILNFVKRSTSFVVHIRPWTQEHIQAFVSTFVYFFLFFLSTSTCMSMKHHLGCIVNIYKVSYLVMKKKMSCFFIYICLLPWERLTETSFQFWLLS